MKRLLLTISLIPLLLTGCSSLAQVAKQLKDDPAFVTVHVRTLYGSGFLVRDGRPANGNTVTPEGGVQSLFQPPASVIVTNIQQRVTNIVEVLNDPSNPFSNPFDPALPLPQPFAVSPVPPRAERQPVK